MFLLLYLLNVFQVLFKVKQLFKNATQGSGDPWIVRSDSVCGIIGASTEFQQFEEGMSYPPTCTDRYLSY